VIQLLECLQTALVCNYEALTYSIALQPWRAQAAVNTVP
jgi:hypothetical protein